MSLVLNPKPLQAPSPTHEHQARHDGAQATVSSLHSDSAASAEALGSLAVQTSRAALG